MSKLISSLKSLASTSKSPGEDTNMRFSPTPVPGDSGFNQWRDAMKMVAKLPGGIPPEFRRKLWLSLAEKHLQSRGVDWARVEKFCFNEWINPDDDELGVQIVKDLHRTGCSLFCGAAGQQNQALLKRVLLAYARWNKAVGYCQGFNMLAALILQVMDRSEVDSVKVMIYLIEGVLPESYFANNLRGLSVDMVVFRDLLRMKLPQLSRHLDALQDGARDGNSYEPPLTNVFTMQWFLTLFCNCLPQATVLRVWDLIFLEGNEILLRTAVAIWGRLSDRILAVSSADEFYSIMGVLTREMLEFGLVDPNTLVKSIVAVGACSELNDMRDKYLYNITPWTQTVQTAARKRFRLFYSDEDDQESDVEERAAVTAAYGIGPGAAPGKRKSGSVGGGTAAMQPYTHGHPDRERLALDISALKKQYAKLRERQRQAHIILSSACARQTFGQSNSPSPIAVNHLLLGKSAIVNAHGRRLGPPKGAVPPQRVPPAQPARRDNTLHWKDAKTLRRQSTTDQSAPPPESDSSSYSEDASSSSTELCDDTDRLADFDEFESSDKSNQAAEGIEDKYTGDAKSPTKDLRQPSPNDQTEEKGTVNLKIDSNLSHDTQETLADLNVVAEVTRLQTVYDNNQIIPPYPDSTSTDLLCSTLVEQSTEQTVVQEQVPVVGHILQIDTSPGLEITSSTNDIVLENTTDLKQVQRITLNEESSTLAVVQNENDVYQFNTNLIAFQPNVETEQSPLEIKITDFKYVSPELEESFPAQSNVHDEIGSIIAESDEFNLKDSQDTVTSTTSGEDKYELLRDMIIASHNENICMDEIGITQSSSFIQITPVSGDVTPMKSITPQFEHVSDDSMDIPVTEIGDDDVFSEVKEECIEIENYIRELAETNQENNDDAASKESFEMNLIGLNERNAHQLSDETESGSDNLTATNGVSSDVIITENTEQKISVTEEYDSYVNMDSSRLTSITEELSMFSERPKCNSQYTSNSVEDIRSMVVEVSQTSDLDLSLGEKIQSESRTTSDNGSKDENKLLRWNFKQESIDYDSDSTNNYVTNEMIFGAPENQDVQKYPLERVLEDSTISNKIDIKSDDNHVEGLNEPERKENYPWSDVQNITETTPMGTNTTNANEQLLNIDIPKFDYLSGIMDDISHSLLSESLPIVTYTSPEITNESSISPPSKIRPVTPEDPKILMKYNTKLGDDQIYSDFVREIKSLKNVLEETDSSVSTKIGDSPKKYPHYFEQFLDETVKTLKGLDFESTSVGTEASTSSAYQDLTSEPLSDTYLSSSTDLAESKKTTPSTDLLVIQERLEAGRKNSSRALEIIQENSLILHKILQHQSKSLDKESGMFEDEHMTRSPISKVFVRSESLKTPAEMSEKKTGGGFTYDFDETEEIVEELNEMEECIPDEEDPIEWQTFKRFEGEFSKSPVDISIPENQDSPTRYSDELEKKMLFTCVNSDTALSMKNDDFHVTFKTDKIDEERINEHSKHDSDIVLEDSDDHQTREETHRILISYEEIENIVPSPKKCESVNDNDQVQLEKGILKKAGGDQVIISVDIDFQEILKSPRRTLEDTENTKRSVRYLNQLELEHKNSREDSHSYSHEDLSQIPSRNITGDRLSLNVRPKSAVYTFEDGEIEDILKRGKDFASRFESDGDFRLERRKQKSQDFLCELPSGRSPIRSDEDTFRLQSEVRQTDEEIRNLKLSDLNSPLRPYRCNVAGSIKDTRSTYRSDSEERKLVDTSEPFALCGRVNADLPALRVEPSSTVISPTDNNSGGLSEDQTISRERSWSDKCPRASRRPWDTSPGQAENTVARRLTLGTHGSLLEPNAGRSSSAPNTRRVSPGREGPSPPEPNSSLSCLSFTSFRVDTACAGTSLGPICRRGGGHDASPTGAAKVFPEPEAGAGHRFALPTLSPPRRKPAPHGPFPTRPSDRRPSEFAVKLGLYRDPGSPGSPGSPR